MDKNVFKFLKNAKGHFQTIHEHRALVRKGCFSVGLYFQGICHDLSKFSPTEFVVGMKYYQGYRSPNNAEREEIGYSSAWLHHKGRNKHHYEYWLDYSSRIAGGFVPARMPKRYLVEMFMDRVAASKTYNKGHFTNDMPLQYFMKGKDFAFIEAKTAKELEKMLTLYANEGEEVVREYIRDDFLKGYPGVYISKLVDRVKDKINGK